MRWRGTSGPDLLRALRNPLSRLATLVPDWVRLDTGFKLLTYCSLVGRLELVEVVGEGGGIDVSGGSVRALPRGPVEEFGQCRGCLCGVLFGKEGPPVHSAAADLVGKLLPQSEWSAFVVIPGGEWPM